MFSHLTLGVQDLDRAIRFYSPILETLNLELKFNEPEMFWAGWKMPGEEGPLFVICHPFNDQPAHAGNGHMVAFAAATRALVDTCYKSALAQGGTCEGPPGLRPQYHPDYYGAYFRDPDGNKICVCCHKPPAAS